MGAPLVPGSRAEDEDAPGAPVTAPSVVESSIRYCAFRNMYPVIMTLNMSWARFSPTCETRGGESESECESWGSSNESDNERERGTCQVLPHLRDRGRGQHVVEGGS